MISTPYILFFPTAAVPPPAATAVTMATKARPPPPPKPKSPAKSTGGIAAAAITSHNGNGLTAAHISADGTNANSTGTNNGTSGQQHNGTAVTPAASLPPPGDQESVVMTPRGKTATSTVILIERQLVERIGERQHVAGGQHAGIIINKDELAERRSDRLQPQLSLEFRVFLVSAQTGEHSQESRALRFWFRDWLSDGDRQAHVAQDFFRELVAPKEFPRSEHPRTHELYPPILFYIHEFFSDYVGFITKIMKLMQKGYNEIQALEVELRILEQTSAPPSRPRKHSFLFSHFQYLHLQLCSTCIFHCNRKRIVNAFHK